jgi:PAS domain S-box-containing protein
VPTRFSGSSALWSPLQYFIAILAVIFVAEAGVMYLLPFLLPPDVDASVEALCDAAILTIISAPLLWQLLIRPMRMVASNEATKYATIVEMARDAILTINDSGLIVSANEATTAMLGDETKLSLIIRQPIGQILLHHHSDPIDALRTAAGTKRARIEADLVNNAGAMVPVEVTVSKISLRGYLYFTLIVRDITERKRAESLLADANRKLIDTAHMAGKAEVATSVLHNVGNVLTSINVLASTVHEKVAGSRCSGLAKAVGLIREYKDNLAEFLTSDQRGRQLPSYLEKLSDTLASEQRELLGDLVSLNNNVQHANQIVAAQQSHARVQSFAEQTDLSELLESAVTVIMASCQRHSVKVIHDIDQAPGILIDRHKLIQIVVNLLTNAKDAVAELPVADRRIDVRAFPISSQQVQIEVQDSGVGIEKSQLTKIFSQGFTTKKNGHGFGLHYCSLAASELGGSLTVQSDGPGTGSTFTLTLPLRCTAHELSR